MRRTSKTVIVLLPLVAAAALCACDRSEQAADAPDTMSSAPATAAVPPSTDSAESGQQVFTFSVGALSAYSLRDGGVSVPNDNKVFGVGRTSADVSAVLAAAGMPTDTLGLSIQPLLVKSSGRVLLFDAGAGSAMGPDAGHLADALAAIAVPADAITDIFISHLHGDHVGGLVNVAGTAVFPNATVHLSSAEWNTLRSLTPEEAAGYFIPNHPALISAITAKVDTFEPGAEIIAGLVRAVDIKGHTPGHSGYLISSGTDSLLFIGDAMHHSVLSVQQPEWSLAFDKDSARAANSRTELLAKSASTSQRIHAVHFPFPGLGRFEQRNGGYRWVAEPQR